VVTAARWDTLSGVNGSPLSEMVLRAATVRERGRHAAQTAPLRSRLVDVRYLWDRLSRKSLQPTNRFGLPRI
jgi:hypothetical protein